eukprot:scaffold22545_cov126-Isochrysis_galbana.AAC.2
MRSEPSNPASERITPCTRNWVRARSPPFGLSAEPMSGARVAAATSPAATASASMGSRTARTIAKIVCSCSSDRRKWSARASASESEPNARTSVKACVPRGRMQWYSWSSRPNWSTR